MIWEAKKVNPGPGESCYFAIFGEIPSTTRSGVIADTLNSDYVLTIEEEGKYAPHGCGAGPSCGLHRCGAGMFSPRPVVRPTECSHRQGRGTLTNVLRFKPLPPRGAAFGV